MRRKIGVAITTTMSLGLLVASFWMSTFLNGWKISLIIYSCAILFVGLFVFGCYLSFSGRD